MRASVLSAPGRKMPNQELIREIATQAWSEALEEKSQELAEAVARRMGAALASQLPEVVQPAQPPRSRELRDGTLLIAGSKTQTETLESLLSACSVVTPACGLLVLRGNQAGGWNCMGLTSADNFKRAVLDCSQGVAAAVLNTCAGRTARASELDAAFSARLGLESSAEVLLLPVLLKERVAALLLAVSGSSDDMAGLEVLVQVAQLALDLQAYRKAAPQQPAVQAARPAAASPVPVPTAAAETGSSMSASASPAPASMPASAVHPAAAYAATASAVAVAPPPEVAAASPSHTAMPAVDETHDRARRFAKLLVDEIKLYNQGKVAEGRSRGDLYSRLHEDIEKSRAAYQKRYGECVKDVDYFTQELIRILADNDRSVMGTGFPG
jgi:hypothetical protein